MNQSSGPRDPRSINIPLVNRALAGVFQSVGSEEKLFQMMRKFYQRMSEDILLLHFFTGRDLDAIAKKQTEFLLKAMGVSASYNGKPPAQAHDEIPEILEGHFNRRLVVLEQILREFGLSQNEIDLWISFENAFKSQIVKS